VLPLIVLLAIPPAPQDIGGSLAFQGQDIIGGAAIIFKAPKRVKDLTGGAAAMMASSRRPPRTGRSSDVARNNPAERRPPTTTTDTTATATATERAETLKSQGNTYYDQGQFAQALEEFGKVEAMPKLEGKRMGMLMMPKAGKK
jgi:hypothetical protein